jgi:ankyrin repeat protein
VKKALCAVVGFVCLAGSGRAQTAEDFFRAIRGGDLETLRKLSANPNVKDRLDTTPLHYAAIYGNAEAVRILLEHGADPAARNKSEATPLIYAAYNFDKTKLLVEKGSYVNAHCASGMTPLLIATSVHGNIATVRYLIEKGADLKAVGPIGSDALQTAALKGDIEMVRLLLAKGADPSQKDKGGFTALLNSFQTNDPEMTKMLLSAGSDTNVANTFTGQVKNGPIQMIHMTPVFMAAPEAEPSVVKSLLSAGAHPDEGDMRKMTPLMFAVAVDRPSLENVRQLIAAHADVNAKDRNGESVLDWANKFANPDVIKMLKTAGAKSGTPSVLPQRPADFMAGAPTDAVARASALLAKTGDIFFAEGGGCVGCHHQPLNARAYAALKAAGQKPEERLRQTFLDGMVAVRPDTLSNLPLHTARGGDFDELISEMQTLSELGEPANPTTDAIVHYLASRQSESGAWEMAGIQRPPLEGSSITRTAFAARALKNYGWAARRGEFDERTARARTWLLHAKPATTYEEADRIMGLKALGTSSDEIERAAMALTKRQRLDGGWAQTNYLGSDPYATAMALSTLYNAGLLKASDAAYTRGVAYLMKTQFPDGSWYTRSRSPKLQPYFLSGFPYDHDQWISAATTAMAVMALAPALQ